MKKHILLVILLTSCVLFAQGSKSDLKGKIGISFYGGANIPVNGNISSTITTNDLIYPGPHFGLGLSYNVTNEFGVEAVVGIGLNYYKDKFRFNGKQPVISSKSFYLNGIYNFGYFFKKTGIYPYVKTGIGVYDWRHLDDTPWEIGNIIVNNGIEQTASSFGLNIGIGADYSVRKNFMFGLELGYNMYFPKDENKYGKDFGTQGYFTPKIKFSYYLPTN